MTVNTTHARPRARIAILSHGTSEFDSRAQRIARTCAAAGDTVTIYSRFLAGLPAEEELHGYRIVRLPLSAEDARQAAAGATGSTEATSSAGASPTPRTVCVAKADHGARTHDGCRPGRRSGSASGSSLSDPGSALPGSRTRSSRMTSGMACGLGRCLRSRRCGPGTAGTRCTTPATCSCDHACSTTCPGGSAPS